MELLDHVGRYRVRELIGTGAFCAVYLAQDEALDDVVAVKVLADNWSYDLEVRARFIDEARFLRRVRSEYLIRVHDIGETHDGRPYFVMDHAEGGSVDQRLRRLTDGAAGAIHREDVLAVARALARGLSDLHREGLVHRDVKPSNLLVRSPRRAAGPDPDQSAGRLFAPGERVLLADMGLAKDLAAGSGLTIHAGSPGYMAPEQRAGGRVDGRADIYAASAVILRLLAGVAPTAGKRPFLPDSVDARVGKVLRRGLSEDPDRRHRDAAMWLADLESALEPPPQPLADTPRRTRRSRVVVTSLVAGVAAAVVVAFASASGSSKGPDASIVGPSSVEIGTRATYRAEAPDAVSLYWTDWNGAIIQGSEFWVQPTSEGRLRFRLTAVDAEGDATTVERTIELREPAR